MKIIECFPVKDVGKAEVGIEIEMEGDNLPMIVNGWMIDQDGSLRGPSAEYVLKGPCERSKVEEKLDTLWAAFKNAGAKLKPSDRCGVHVHLNVQTLTVSEVFNFIILYLVFEDLLVRWCGEEREGNLFCLRAQDAEWLLMALIRDRQQNRLHSVVDQQNYRYASINLSALGKYGSVEFRSLQTTNKSQPIKDFAGMLLRLKDYSLTVNDPKDFLTACSVNGASRFKDTVFGKDYGKLLQVRDEEQLIMEGVRRVQALAFIPFVEQEAPPKPQFQPKQRDPAGQNPDGFLEFILQQRHAIERERDAQARALNELLFAPDQAQPANIIADEPNWMEDIVPRRNVVVENNRLGHIIDDIDQEEQLIDWELHGDDPDFNEGEVDQ